MLEDEHQIIDGYSDSLMFDAYLGNVDSEYSIHSWNILYFFYGIRLLLMIDAAASIYSQILDSLPSFNY